VLHPNAQRDCDSTGAGGSVRRGRRQSERGASVRAVGAAARGLQAQGRGSANRHLQKRPRGGRVAANGRTPIAAAHPQGETG